MFDIDKDVPIPGRLTKYPFMNMRIGDSFLAFGADIPRARSAARMHARRYGIYFVTRIEDDGVRIWRTE